MKIEHVGSTAIIGMCAEPTIDIAATIGNFASLDWPDIETIYGGPRFLNVF